MLRDQELHTHQLGKISLTIQSVDENVSNESHIYCGWEPSFTEVGRVNGCKQLGKPILRLKIYIVQLISTFPLLSIYTYVWKDMWNIYRDIIYNSPQLKTAQFGNSSEMGKIKVSIYIMEYCSVIIYKTIDTCEWTSQSKISKWRRQRREGEERIHCVWFHLSYIKKQVKICNPF